MCSQRLKNKKNDFGWIEIICGSMFSGKTEELIRRAKRVKLAKQKIKIFKPKEDVRFKKNLNQFLDDFIISIISLSFTRA